MGRAPSTTRKRIGGNSVYRSSSRRATNQRVHTSTHRRARVSGHVARSLSLEVDDTMCHTHRSTPRRQSRRLSVRREPVEDSREDDVPSQLHSQFEEEFSSATYETVNVDQCVSLPFLRSRPITEFTVKSFQHMFTGGSLGSITGHIAAGGTPIVVELPQHLIQNALQQFLDIERDRTESEIWVSTRKIYHVVDGGSRHRALWLIGEKGGAIFGGSLTWKVKVLPWQEPRVLKAISLLRNHLQSQDFVTEVTFADDVFNLREVIDEHVREKSLVLVAGKPLPRGFSQDIVDRYGGQRPYNNVSLRTLTPIVAKLSTKTVQIFRMLLDEEVPHVADATVSRAKSGKSDVRPKDVRSFRGLVNMKTLRGSKLFDGGSAMDEDRENALHRIRHTAQETECFKGVDSKILDEMTQKAMDARFETEKLLKVIGVTAVPASMHVCVNNLLRTQMMDEEVHRNKSNENEILRTLRNRYISTGGARAATKLDQYEKMMGDISNALPIGTVDATTSNSEAPGTFASNDPEDTIPGSLENSTSVPPILPGDHSEQLPIYAECLPDGQEGDASPAENSAHQPAEVSSDCQMKEVEQNPEPTVLQKCKIEVYNMGWEAYNLTVLEKQSLFDLVISDPFQAPAGNEPIYFDDEAKGNLVAFIRKVLVPGGFVFLIVPIEQHADWIRIFSAKQLLPEKPFTLLRDPKTVQRTRGKSLQTPLEIGVVARKPGKSPAGFEIDDTIPYSFLKQCTFTRRFSAIDMIPAPTDRLKYHRSKAHVRINEKPISLFTELLTTFCPKGGNVLDPFAGTLTVGISCIRTMRKCVLIETDKECYFLALPRLETHADAILSDMKEISTVVDDQANGGARSQDDVQGLVEDDVDLVPAEVQPDANEEENIEELPETPMIRIKLPLRSPPQRRTLRRKCRRPAQS